MKRNRTLCGISLGLIAAAAGCALTARSPKAYAPTRVEYPVIVSLVGRNDVITITAGPKSPLYSAKTKEGVVLVSNVTLNELRESHPRVYKQVYPAITVQADGSDAVVGGYAGMGLE